MIELHPMTEKAYDFFDSLSRLDYAQAKARGERLSLSEGEKISMEAWKVLLPQGQQTPQHHFYTAWYQGQDVGMVWFKEDRNWETPYAYIYQVWIWDKFQGQGLGKALMNALEAKAHSIGLKRLRLHVFAFNERAIGLYEAMGYETTNIVMMKDLEK